MFRFSLFIYRLSFGGLRSINKCNISVNYNNLGITDFFFKLLFLFITQLYEIRESDWSNAFHDEVLLFALTFLQT